MIVYLSVMFLCCILLYAMRNDKIKQRPLAIVFGIIWLMIFMQEGWGGDYENYLDLYDKIHGSDFGDVLNNDYHGEVGFHILIWIMPSFHTWFAVAMAAWCFAMAFFFYHFVPQKWWFFAILFVFFDRAILMGMIASFSRMAIANTFLIFAMYLVSKEEKIWKSALLLFFGYFFHKSVLFIAPLVFLKPKQNRLPVPVLVGIIALIALVFSLSPSSWINIVENIIYSMDEFSSYEYYLESQVETQTKGLVLIILFYWIYFLTRYTGNINYNSCEYLMMKLALVRIVFDLLPSVGMSTRFFYYIDVYFFAGMMVVLSRLPKNNIHKWGLAITLLMMFWFTGFHSYAATDFYKEHWGTYNLYF